MYVSARVQSGSWILISPPFENDSDIRFAMLANPEILELCKQAQQDDGKVVSIYNEIKKIGLECGQCIVREYKPKEVGVHRGNREGAMCSGAEAMYDEQINNQYL